MNTNTPDITSHREIISQFETAEQLGDELGEKGGTVRAWSHRDSIPAEHWPGVVAAALKFEKQGVTLELLAALAPRRKRQAEQANGEAA